MRAFRGTFAATRVTPSVARALPRVHVSVAVSFTPCGELWTHITASLNHSEIPIVFATQDHIPALLKLAPKCPNLKMVVAMDELSEETKRVLKAWGETLQVDVKEISERMWLSEVVTDGSR